MKAKNSITVFVLSVAVPLAAGSLAAYLARDGIRLYALMPKPPLSPPAFLFPVVWTLLYVLMGLACGLVYQSKASPGRKKKALGVYGIQLGLNFLWPLIFFGAELYLAALVCLAALSLAVMLCTLLFYHINSAAGRLLLPYDAWCLFALYLNFSTILLMK